MTSQRTLRGLCSSQSTFNCVYTMIMIVISARQRNSIGAVGDLTVLSRRLNFVSSAYLSEHRAIARRFCMLKVRAIARCYMPSCRVNQCRWRCLVSACRRLYCVFLSFLDFFKGRSMIAFRTHHQYDSRLSNHYRKNIKGGDDGYFNFL